MSEIREIASKTIATVINGVVTIYTYFVESAAAFLSFFIQETESTVNDVSFEEGDLGYTKDVLPSFSANVSMLGELSVVDDDTDDYFIDDFGSLIKGTPLAGGYATHPYNIGYYDLAVRWRVVEGAIGYYLDISTDMEFKTYVSGYQCKYISVEEVIATQHSYAGYQCFWYNATGLDPQTGYYYRIRPFDGYQVGGVSNIYFWETKFYILDYDGNQYTSVVIGTQEWLVGNLKTTHYKDGTPIPNQISNGYSDWFLPSKDLLSQLYTNLKLEGIGGFGSSYYWSSSEVNATSCWVVDFSDGTPGSTVKSGSKASRACRVFTDDPGAYSLGDVGPAGGWIGYIDGTTYYEAAPEDNNGIVWSNITDVLIGTTSTDIAESQNNTNEIIAQPGHTTSAAKSCDDLIVGGWCGDTIGAYCWYDNDIDNKEDYGALYDWPAVNNAHGLAIDGWRIPTKTDLDDLNDYLVSNQGAKLALPDTNYWSLIDYFTNETGFSAKGSGFRNVDGKYFQLKDSFYIHSSTLYDGNHSWAAYITAGGTGFTIAYKQTDPPHGFSVRCVRDVV